MQQNLPVLNFSSYLDPWISTVNNSNNWSKRKFYSYTFLRLIFVIWWIFVPRWISCFLNVWSCLFPNLRFTFKVFCLTHYFFFGTCETINLSAILGLVSKRSDRGRWYKKKSQGRRSKEKKLLKRTEKEREWRGSNLSIFLRAVGTILSRHALFSLIVFKATVLETKMKARRGESGYRSKRKK